MENYYCPVFLFLFTYSLILIDFSSFSFPVNSLSLTFSSQDPKADDRRPSRRADHQDSRQVDGRGT